MPVSFVSPVAAAVLATTLAGSGMPARAAADTPSRPVPDDIVTLLHGVRVADPYGALEDLSAPATQAWVDASDDEARKLLDRVPDLAALRRRVAALDLDRPPAIRAVQVAADGRWFYLKRAPDAGVAQLVVRENATAPERVLSMPEAQGAGAAQAIERYAVSPDGRHVSVVTARNEGELGELRVLDVATGKEESTPMSGVASEGAPAWTADGRGLLVVRSRAPHDVAASAPTPKIAPRIPLQLWQRAPAGGPDRLLAGAGAPFGPPIGERDRIVQDADDGTHLVLAAREDIARDARLWVTDLDALVREPSTARWTALATADAKLRDWSVSGHWLYALSAKDAPRLRIVRYDLDQPQRAPLAVVAPPHGVVEALRGAADGLYFTVRSASTSTLFHLGDGAQARPQAVSLPFSGAVTFLQGSPRLPGVVVGLEGWTRETQILAVRGARSTTTELVPPRNSSLGENWEAETLACRSADGGAATMTLVHRGGLKRDASHPVMLAAGDGDAAPAFFDPRREAFIARGGLLADVAPRDVHDASRADAWRDMIACARTLVDGRYTTPARLAIEGTGLGGIAAGRAITERPELFRAGILRSGITDTVRFLEASGNDRALASSIGSLATADGVRQLLAMSTYDRVRDGTTYPALLFTTRRQDTRVAPWNTLKTFARMQAASTGGRPVLLRVEPPTARGWSRETRDDTGYADRLAFVLWQTGDADFRPVFDK